VKKFKVGLVESPKNPSQKTSGSQTLATRPLDSPELVSAVSEMSRCRFQCGSSRSRILSLQGLRLTRGSSVTAAQTPAATSWTPKDSSCVQKVFSDMLVVWI